ncbi:MAG: SH3 domain-containing protein, partial [candidate division NC10 bacterium]
MARAPSHLLRYQAARLFQRRTGGWLATLLLAGLLRAGEVQAVDALILGRDVLIRQMPQVSAKVIKTTRPGETYEVIGRKPGKGQPLYIFDERGDLWVKVRVSDEMYGFIRTDLVSVSREEFRSPRGNPLLIVNLRPTADGAVARELWLVQNDWQQTRRLGPIEGKPI